MNEGVAASPYRRRIRHGHHSPLDYMMSGVDQIQKIFRHEKPISPEDRHLIQGHIANFQQSDRGSTHEHMGTIDYTSTDTDPNSDNYHQNFKVHIIRSWSPRGLPWQGAYTREKHFDPKTHTQHTTVYLNKQHLPSTHGSSPHGLSRDLLTTVTHELSHAIQDNIKGVFTDKSYRGGSAKKGTARLPGAEPVNKRQRKVAKQARAAGLTPSEWMWMGGTHGIRSNYWHTGVETEARIHQWIPDILEKIQNHHDRSGTDRKIQDIVTNMKNYSSGMKSQKAKDYYFNKAYSNLFDTMANEFSKSHTQHILPDQPDTPMLTHLDKTPHLHHPEGPLLTKDLRQRPGSDDIRGGAPTDYNIQGVDNSAVPKAITTRRDKIIANQSHNMRLLSKEINDRVLNSMIKKHSGHDVLASRASRIPHSEQRQQKVIEKRARRKKETKSDTTIPTEKPAETKINEPINTGTEVPKKQSFLSKIRNIIFGNKPKGNE